MMGKTQKFSKGHPLGFVPDYRHGLETLGESKGRSLGQIDSRSSCTFPKRKCKFLNTEDGGEVTLFDMPRDVFMLPRMSSSDRKNLEMRLQRELEQVRALQGRLFSRPAAVSMNGGAVSALGGDVVAKRNDGKLKQSNSVWSGRGVPQTAAPPVINSSNYTEAFKQCRNLLNKLVSHHWSGPFLAPVDAVKLNIPDYFNIIKQPMDFGTIRTKLNGGKYSTPWDFAADVKLTFENAMTYNPVTNDVHMMAKTLKHSFELRWKFIEKKLPTPDGKLSVTREPSKNGAIKKDNIENDYPSKKKLLKKGAHKKDIFKKEDAVTKQVLQPKKRKASPLVQDTLEVPVVEAAKVIEDVQVVHSTKEITMNKQKFDLSVRLQSYGELIPDHIVDFIRKQIADDNEADEDELELDMNVLSDSTLTELQKLLDNYERVNESGSPAKDGPREFHSEYGLSNSSINHEGGNEFIEEDVDIGGNEPPLLTYPPVVLENEAADRSSKHNTSSSSSSASESSSSDSDSSSSSGIDLDVKVPPTGGAKDDIVSVRLDQENDISGENVSENQVSTGKQYRAAVLLNRFADTIFKAREKTLDQGAKKDPDKLQHEMEELERLRREERARLQAEAKAAEVARKRAEATAAAEAAAEAKRQRELDREAARKALQEMEKTVEINEGDLFLKDLEILGTTTTGEQFPSSVGETSPTHTPEALGFQLGSNPLEKLGLFMKNDDEEDEEGVSADEQTIDVEEGEID
ncbi:hypothetical protein GUJ93_ZPchr0008g12885 [Zizania palustris]|uniref:Uncharacterized protein n=1 Tax=Zizania palustris TaxID=103762 RepID=A0A8J5V1H6_ZIZPA|nr:hypothetical protein GUJ93_ZPchr0008g12885 [Zizania palustris]